MKRIVTQIAEEVEILPMSISTYKVDCQKTMKNCAEKHHFFQRVIATSARCELASTCAANLGRQLIGTLKLIYGIEEKLLL